MSGDKFEWDENRVKEFVRWNFDRQDHNYLPAALEQFKQEQLKSKRDWEIVSYVNAPTIVSGGGEKTFGVIEKNSSRWSIAVLENYPIYSVRRLSDGEVFSVGDEVERYGKISSFHIKFGQLCVWMNDDIQNAEFNKLQKAKQSLFKTEDGVEIFKGDEYWYVVTSDYDCLSGIKWSALKHKADWEGGWNNRPPLGAKQFGTEDLANDYILMNKPMLSLKEVSDASFIAGNDYALAGNIHYQRLLKLAKQKLNMKT